MGGQNSKVLTHKDVCGEMNKYYEDLPQQDKDLYNFALTRLTEESKKFELKSVEVGFIFSNNLTVNVTSNDKPENCFVATHDGRGGFYADWETESPARYVFRLLTQSIEEFLSWLGELTRTAAYGVSGTGRKAYAC